MNCRLVQVYVDHVHQNNGHHMEGVITDDNVWQVWWHLLVIQKRSRYQASQRDVSWRFVKCLSEQLRGAIEKRWNVERPMVFMGVILKKTPGARKAHDICHRIMQCLDMW